MIDNDRLEIGIYSDDEVLLNFIDLNDCFPQNVKFVWLGLKWKTHFHPWYKEVYPLKSFYSSILEKNILYPKTYKEFFFNLEIILSEHSAMGTIGIDDEAGEFCSLKYKAENELISMVGEIFNFNKTTVAALPLYVE